MFDLVKPLNLASDAVNEAENDAAKLKQDLKPQFLLIDGLIDSTKRQLESLMSKLTSCDAETDSASNSPVTIYAYRSNAYRPAMALSGDQGNALTARFKPGANALQGNIVVGGGDARPWVTILKASISGLDDDRRGSDRDADIYNAALGTAFQISEFWMLGLSGSLSTGDVTSAGLATTLDGTYYGVTLFANAALSPILNLGLSAGYTHGENDITIAGPRDRSAMTFSVLRRRFRAP